MYKKLMTSHAFRYLLVGGTAFITEYGVFLLFMTAFTNHMVILAQTISFCMGLVVSFAGNRLFTFSSAEGNFQHTEKKQFTVYLILALVNLLVTNILIYILVEQIAVVPWIAKILTMLSVVAWNFVIYKKFIFRQM